MRHYLAIATGLLLTLLLHVGAAAEPAAGVDELMQSLSIDVVNNRAAEVAASDRLDEQTKADLAELYRTTIANLETTQSYREATEGFRRAIDAGPDRAQRLRAELEEATAASKRQVALPLDATLPEIKRELQKQKADLAGQETALADLGNRVDVLEARPAAIRQRLSEARRRIIEIDTSLGEPAGAETELAQARRWAGVTRLDLLRAEVLMLEQELASQPIRLDLLRLQRDLADLDLRTVNRRVRALEGAANERRLAEARQAKSEAEAVEREVASAHPLVAELAARNARLVDEIDALAGAIQDIEREQRIAADEAKRLEEGFDTTRQKIEVAGLSQILGQVLQDQRRTLPSVSSFAKGVRERERRIAETTLSQILLEEEQVALRDIPAYLAQLLDRLPPAERAEILGPMIQLAEVRQSLVDRALTTQRTFLQAMGELDFAVNRLADVVRRFDAFLDKRLLWVRSTQVVGLESIRLVPGQLADLMDPQNWQDVAETGLKILQTSGWFWLALLVGTALWLLRKQLRRVVAQSGEHVGNIMEDSLSATLRGIAAVVLLASPWPLVVFVVGIEMQGSFEAGQFARQFGFMLTMLAPLGFQLRALRHFVRSGSIAEVHFGWQQDGLRRLYLDLGWFTPALLLLTAATMLSLAGLGSGPWGSGLGRAFFLLVMVVLAVFFVRLAHPRLGTLRLLFLDSPDSVMIRYRYLWFVLAIAVPVGAGIVALAGFMYTAGTLIGHILETAWFSLAVLVVHQLIVRWLVINQRRLRLQALRARRQAEMEARAAKGAVDEGEGGTVLDVEEPKVDFKALDATSRKLTGNTTLLVALTGLWLIWRDMLPALRIFDDVTLWTYTKSTAEGEVPITLTTLGVVLLILFLMVLATRQLPAFLEITLLQRLRMSQGSRYTALTLTKYTVVAVSIAWVFSMLGGSWSEIQWIFAALGVGIGFGLQEIVANFISGLIILFERPIRVGDVVTVGNTDGVVTRIQIRATTIRNWDRKELLVPNKNFITQELLNWSLSDSTTRIMIQVGIAYGSDVERALRILEQVAVDHPRILRDPAPLVVFEAFGDNALLLSLRCYIDDIDFRLRTTTELNLEINRQMAEAGIEIAFPQRDIHLDTNQPLEVRLQRGSPETP